MFVTIVRMPGLPEPLDRDQAAAMFSDNAASYLDVPGLLFKAYLRSPDGTTTGGVYWWRDRTSAEAKFNDGWFAGVSAKYGGAPVIEWFDAPVVVDPRSGDVFTAPPGVDLPPS